MQFWLTSSLLQAILSALLVCAALVVFLLRFARGRLWVGIALGVALADQMSKLAVLHFLRGGKGISLPGPASLVYYENRLLGFGLSDPGLLSATLASLAALLLLYFRLRRFGYRMGPLAELACALILGGCVAILIDRVGRGFVVDWLDFGPKTEFIYNLADLAVLTAVVLLVARGAQFFLRRREPSRTNTFAAGPVPHGNGAGPSAGGPGEEGKEPLPLPPSALPDAEEVGRMAAQAMRSRFGDLSPRAIAKALGIRVTHRPLPPPGLVSLRLRSEYLTNSATIVLYDEPLAELAHLICAKRPALANLNLEALHIAHEIFHHLEAGRPSTSEKAAHAFVAELLCLDFSPEELDSLYPAKHP